MLLGVSSFLLRDLLGAAVEPAAALDDNFILGKL